MTEQHTQGRLDFESGGLCDGYIITSEGLPVARDLRFDDAQEFVRRWNAFELGGAVERMSEALIDTTAALGGAIEQIKALNSTPSGNSKRALQTGIEVIRAALVEPGAGEGL